MATGIPESYGLDIVARGDHEVHRFGFEGDVEITHDRNSQTLTIDIELADAENLYWWLVEIIPKLRKDRP